MIYKQLLELEKHGDEDCSDGFKPNSPIATVDELELHPLHVEISPPKRALYFGDCRTTTTYP